MLPIFAGRSVNLADSVNKSHPLYLIPMAAGYRFLPPLSNFSTVRNLTGDGTLDASLLLNARIYGPDGPTRGGSARQSTGQTVQIPAAIWSGRAMTVALWARFNAFPNIGSVFDTVNKDFSFHVGGGSPTATTCEVYRTGNSSGTISLSTTLYSSVWYRLVVGIDNAGAVTVWVDGLAAGSGTIATAALADADVLLMGDNPSGGANVFDGFFADIFIWRAKLNDAQALLDYKEAIADYPKLFPKQSIWQRSPATTGSYTATVSSIGTIYLTVSTVSAAGITDATADVSSIGTITLTVPTLTAGESSEATVSSIGTITLTVPTLTATSPDNTATVSRIGTITLYAPTVAPIGAKPPNNYNQQFFWGRFTRGQYVNVIFQPLYLPDDIPVATFWLEGTTAVATVSLPCTDNDDVTFGMPVLLDGDFDDGHYVVTISFSVDYLPYTVICYMEVIGGTPRYPVTSLLEIDRSNGRGVVYSEAGGYVRLGYSPSTSGELE